MKLKLIIGLSVITVLSLFANLVISLNLTQALAEKDDAIDQSQNYEKKLEELEEKTTQESRQEYVNGDAIEQLIESFFRTHYEYDQSSYKERIPNIKEYVSDEVYGQLTTAGVPEVPSIEFSNTVENIQIYLTEKSSHVESLILLDTTYQVADFDNSVITQLFNVEVNDNVITKLELVGTFSKLSES